MPATWTPSAAVRSIGIAVQGTIPNVQGSMLTIDRVEEIQLPVKPGVRVLATFLRSRWGLSSAGTARGAAIRRPPRGVNGQLRRRDVHEEGRAIDAMTSDVAKGDSIADWCVTHAAQLGIQYVIWRRTEWSSSSRSPAWEPYSGTNPHTDHVHIEVTPALAADGEAMRAAIEAITGERLPDAPPNSSRPAVPPTPAPATVSAPSSAAPVLAALAALAGAGWFFSRKKSRK